ncbi:MAG: hypothetical protein AAGF97_19035 [Planctomycetota bacterium]
MDHLKLGGLLLIVACPTLAGCSGDSSAEVAYNASPSATPASNRPSAPPPPPPQLGDGTTATVSTPNPSANVDPSTGNAVSPDDAPPSGGERVKAETGVGKKGRGYGGGIVSEPIHAYFRTGQRIQFLQMEKGMKEFRAIHDRLPESHEEFMEKIIEEYGVTLPELPPGESYVYDPEQGELMVQRPE